MIESSIAVGRSAHPLMTPMPDRPRNSSEKQSAIASGLERPMSETRRRTVSSGAAAVHAPVVRENACAAGGAPDGSRFHGMGGGGSQRNTVEAIDWTVEPPHQ